MPNHIMNLITLNGDEKVIEELRMQLKQSDGELGSLDFQKIIPMPESLNIEAGTKTDFGMKLYLIAEALAIPQEQYAESGDKIRAVLRHTDYMAVSRVDDKTLEEDLKIGKIAVENIKKYGASDWYDWCIENWGTKWNGYDSEVCEDNQFKFCTAWSAPHPILKKLSELYPEITITHQWADEDYGFNLGHREYLNGEMTYERELDEGTMFAKKYACDLFGCQYEFYEQEEVETEEQMLC